MQNHAPYSRYEHSRHAMEQTRRINNARISLNKQLFDHSYNSALNSLDRGLPTQQEKRNQSIIYNRGVTVNLDSDDAVFSVIHLPMYISPYTQRNSSTKFQSRANTLTHGGSNSLSNIHNQSSPYSSGINNSESHQAEQKLFQDFERSLDSFQQEISVLQNIKESTIMNC